ncbi:MAG: metallophosphoesterase family protein [Polyangiales bacterium]
MATSLASGSLGFISDIHGNEAALRAVLTELRKRDVKEIFAAGDLLLGGESNSLDVWKLLQSEKVNCIRGLSDTALSNVSGAALRPKDEAQEESAAAFRRTQAELGEVLLERLRRLPTSLRIPMVDGREILMVHGSPMDETVEISFDMSDEEILMLIGDDPADIVVCGGTHVPFQRMIGDLHVVNVGSVGQAPGPKVAHFTIITPKLEQTSVLQDFVDLEHHE